MVGKKQDFNIVEGLKKLKKAVRKFRTPSVTVIAKKNDPFAVLVSCIISLRTRDEVTKLASARLFTLAKLPAELLKLPNDKIEKAIYPAAFYRKKTKSLKDLCQVLVKEYSGEVPDKLEELLKLKGVGRKTANLTLILGHNKPGICVDIHVHRISNRWGYVKGYNNLLVSFGQNLCKPVSPYCGSCPIEDQCPKIGVNRFRLVNI